MRIEHGGYQETQPVYTHVGYLSAAYDTVYARPTAVASPTWMLGVGTLMLALALMSLRRQGAWARVITVALTASALFAGFGAVYAMRQPKITLIPEFYQTLYNLELAGRDTDRLAAELGRTPTEAEWRQRMAGKPYALDGWEYAFEYQAEKAGAILCDDGRPYRVVTVPERMTKTLGYAPTDRFVWDIGSDLLGKDGVLGTSDDYRGLSHYLREARWTPADRPASPGASPVGGGAQ